MARGIVKIRKEIVIAERILIEFFSLSLFRSSVPLLLPNERTNGPLSLSCLFTFVIGK